MTRRDCLGGLTVTLGITFGVMFGNHFSEPRQVSGAEVEKIDGKTLSFAKDIQPLLQERCANCHNSKKKKAGLDVETSYETAMKAIKANSPEGSRLYKSLLGKGAKLMPPKKKLDENDIEKVRAWIAAGAKKN